MHDICRDLAAEHAALDAVVAKAPEEDWHRPTPAAGWDVQATIGHIGYFDEAARLAVVDEAEFERRKKLLMSGELAPESEYGSMSGRETLLWWRANRSALIAALEKLDPKARLPWYGPPMSALSFATARLMEAWSHGHDVADAMGATMEPTDRLRHVAHIGVTTRGWSYMNRGRAVPEEPVRVELLAPSGATWTWGPEDASNRVWGDALDFCLVVTQRRQVEDTKLDMTGPLAEEWMHLAQAFAGPPTTTDTARAQS